MTVPTCAIELLLAWLRRQLAAAALDWMERAVDEVRRSPSGGVLFLSVSLAARRVGKDDLALSADDLQAAQRVRPGWVPAGWSVDQAARLLLLLHSGRDADRFSERLEQLCRTADVGELVTFYRGLPLYPDAPRHLARAREGVRTNMKAVFEAVAHRNPYPAEQFSDEAWNQMVMKALFIGSALDPIHGLDQRRNADLTRMLLAYAQERRAAHRPVSSELWRCVDY